MCKIKFLGMEELVRKECERLTLKCLKQGDMDLAQEVVYILDSLDAEEREQEWSIMEQAYGEFLEYNEYCIGMIEVNYIPTLVEAC